MQNKSEEQVSTDAIGLITAKVDAFVDGFFYQLPNILAGAALLFVAWLVGRLAASLTRNLSARRGRPDLGVLLGSLVKGILILVAVLMTAAIVFPSVKPADILATLGVGSVAIASLSGTSCRTCSPVSCSWSGGHSGAAIRSWSRIMRELSSTSRAGRLTSRPMTAGG